MQSLMFCLYNFKNKLYIIKGVSVKLLGGAIAGAASVFGINIFKKCLIIL